MNARPPAPGAAWLVLALALCPAASAVPPPAHADSAAAHLLDLWPGGVPAGSRHLSIVERIDDRGVLATGQRDRAISGITRPQLEIHRPPRPDGTALLVIPGGGYARIALDKEGSALLPAFVDRERFTLFVLRYRLPADGHAEGADAPLADAQRALRMIRSCAGAWGLDRQRIGAIGFSAGGHLAASLATGFDRRLLPAVDMRDSASARPDFVLLGYPVIDMAGGHAHAGSRRRLLGADPSPQALRAQSPREHVDARTPPVFLLHAADDTAVPVEHSLGFHQALRAAGVAAELHVYAHGGHGFGMHAIAGSRLAGWPALAADWIRQQPPGPAFATPPVPAADCPPL